MVWAAAAERERPFLGEKNEFFGASLYVSYGILLTKPFPMFGRVRNNQSVFACVVDASHIHIVAFGYAHHLPIVIRYRARQPWGEHCAPL